MGAVKKSFVLFFALILFFCALWPTPRTYAIVNINRFSILDVSSFLIAGYEYTPTFESDRAGSTSVESVKYEYSKDNGVTWINLPTYRTFTGLLSNGDHFILPIDPQLTSAKFKVSAYFSPLIGDNSYSEKTIGPYKILQPGSPSDFIVTPNLDSTVSLTWYDNTNMESYYQITRDGPDGSKTFYVNNTMDNIGPLSFVDKDTNAFESTIYAYTLTTVIDQYNLPANDKPGPLSLLTKTKARPKLADKVNIDLLPHQLNELVDKPKIIVNSVIFNDKWNKYIINMDKVPVNSITLNTKAITLKIEESNTLTATVVPSNAANKKVSWSSDNKEIAAIDSNGKVTGISPGLAKITAKTEDGGFIGVCVVTVTGNPEGDVQPPDQPAIELVDIADHWARKVITKAVALGAVNGYPDATFRPEANVTRAEFTSMLIKGLKPKTQGAQLAFQDNNEIGNWALQPVMQAVKLGIISGYEDGTFRPNANITHAEMISMVVRASGLAADLAQPTGFADDADIPKWAKAAVSTAEKSGIIIVGGNTGNKFTPQVLSTRAEAASAIVGMLQVKK